jgi:hypothetical protein
MKQATPCQNQSRAEAGQGRAVQGKEGTTGWGRAGREGAGQGRAEQDGFRAGERHQDSRGLHALAQRGGERRKG